MASEAVQTVGAFAPFSYGKALPERDRARSGFVPVFGSNGIVGYHDSPLTNGPTVVIGRKGTVGVVHYSPTPCWPIDTTFFVTGSDPALLRFKYYALKSLGLEHMNADSAVPGLNRDAAHARLIRVPEQAEQRAIANVLGPLDDKIELNRRTNETLEAIARALFKSWFVDFDPVRAKSEGCDPGLSPHLADLFPDFFEDSELGELPNGWHAGTLGDLSEKPQYGFTASATDEPLGPKFLRITDINKLPWIEWSSVPFCRASDAEREKYRTRTGDILIARMADPGHGVMIEEDVEAVFASYLIRFRPVDLEYARFIQYWLRSEDYWALVAARHVGTTRASLNAQVMSEFQLIVPPPQVAAAFARIVSALRSRVAANVTGSRSLADIRDALLPELLSGEYRIKNAEHILGRAPP